MTDDQPEEYPVVKFGGSEYFFMTTNGLSGPLTTAERFQNGRISFAHVYEDGTIKRRSEVIGTRKDLVEVRREAIPRPENELLAMAELLGSWLEGDY